MVLPLFFYRMVLLGFLLRKVLQMWSYVGKKAEPRWLWHAIDHQSGTVLGTSHSTKSERAVAWLICRR